MFYTLFYFFVQFVRHRVLSGKAEREREREYKKISRVTIEPTTVTVRRCTIAMNIIILCFSWNVVYVETENLLFFPDRKISEENIVSNLSDTALPIIYIVDYQPD